MKLLSIKQFYEQYEALAGQTVTVSGWVKTKRIGKEVGFVEVGASPRASIGLAQAAKAHAFIQGRAYVTPEDVKAVAMEVLRHRIILSYEAEAEEVSAETVVQKILDSVEVP